MEFEKELYFKVLEEEYGISKEQIETVIEGAKQLVNFVEECIVSIIESLSDVIECLSEIASEVLEYQQELKLSLLTKDQVIEYVVNDFVEKICKRKEPP